MCHENLLPKTRISTAGETFWPPMGADRHKRIDVWAKYETSSSCMRATPHNLFNGDVCIKERSEEGGGLREVLTRNISPFHTTLTTSFTASPQPYQPCIARPETRGQTCMVMSLNVRHSWSQRPVCSLYIMWTWLWDSGDGNHIYTAAPTFVSHYWNGVIICSLVWAAVDLHMW